MRKLDDECPGEYRCARDKSKPIFQAIAVSTTVADRRRIIENPPRTLIDKCCAGCPLFPTKPGQEKCTQSVLAAVDGGCRLEQLLDTNAAGWIYKDSPPSARRIAALLGIKMARNRSDKKRMDEANKGAKTSQGPTYPKEFEF